MLIVDIVREEDQYITKCMDRYLPNGVTVADKLREMFMCGEVVPRSYRINMTILLHEIDPHLCFYIMD